MKVSEFRALLQQSPDADLCLVLPDGGRVPAHFHITEVGRTDRRFIDCGGQVRQVSACTLQAWVANDLDHRLEAGTLAGILEKAAPVLGTDELDVEIEYEDGFISQFPVLGGETGEDAVVFELGTKHTDCLAKEICLPKAGAVSACCTPGGGCC